MEGKVVSDLSYKSDTTLARKYIENGRRFIQSESYEKAIKEFSLAFQYSENYPTAYRLRGWCYYKIENYHKALADYNKSISLGEKEDEYLYKERAMIKRNLEDYKGALEDLNIALKKYPSSSSAYSYRAYLYEVFLGEEKLALSDYTKAIELDTAFYTPYLNRGDIKYNLKDYTGALSDYNKALSINPNLENAYFGKGRVKMQEGNNKEALLCFENAIKIDPKNYDYYLYRGLCYEDLGNYNAAIEDYKMAIKIDPSNYKNYIKIGEIKTKQADYESSFIYYTKSEKIKPDFDGLYSSRGNTYYKMGNYNKALSDFNKAIELKKDPKSYYRRGLVKMDLNDLKGAEIDFIESIKLDSLNPNPYCELGVLKIKQRKSKGAVYYLDKAIKLAPDFTKAYLNRGIARAKLKEKEGAITDMNKVLSVDSTNEKAYYIRGVMNDMNIKDFTKAIAINPRYIDAYEARAKAYIAYSDYLTFAIDDFSSLINLTADTVASYYSDRSTLHFFIGDTLKALEDINKALTIDTVAYYFNARGIYYSYSVDKKYWALSDFNKAIEINKNFGDPYYYRGLLKNDLKDYEGGCEDMNMAEKLNVKAAKEKMKEWILCKMCK